MQKLLFLVPHTPYFFSHRLSLAKAALKQGYEVALATFAPSDSDMQRLSLEGIGCFPLQHVTREGLGLYQQVLALKELCALYNAYRPTIVHHVAIKPVLLGSLAAQLSRIPIVINALGGLGYIFTKDTAKRRFLRSVFLMAMRFFSKKRGCYLILQNEDDIKILISLKAAVPQRTFLVCGVGVNLDIYRCPPLSAKSDYVVTCISRMLWDKGIKEFADAAILVRAAFPEKVTFLLVGDVDEGNPTSINREDLLSWSDHVTWIGPVQDTVPIYRKSHIIVLPSYREGLPKVLIEAASCGKPIITTDVPGCREVVTNRVNGLLVPAENAKALAEALLFLLKNPDEQKRMGQEGRLKAERLFGEGEACQKVLDIYRKAVQDLECRDL